MEVVYIALKPYPSFGGQESFLILQESQTPLFQRGRILSSLLDIPRPVPLYYISCLLGSVCGVDFLPGYLYFPSTTSRTFRGSGQFWITATFAGSMWSPVGVSMNPRYSTVSVWKLHFLGFAYSPAS